MMGALLATAISRAEGEAPDLIRGKSVKPQLVSSPAKAGAQARKRSRKAVADDEDIPDLIAAK